MKKNINQINKKPTRGKERKRISSFFLKSKQNKMGKVKVDRKSAAKKSSSGRVKGGGAGSSGAVQKQGMRFNKDFGQHILKNPLIITNMIEKVCKKIIF